MDMENIANVNANYSASESHKVTSAPAETVHTAATTVSETAEAMTRTVMASGAGGEADMNGKEGIYSDYGCGSAR